MLVHFVDIINNLKNGLITHNFFCWVNPQVKTIFKEYEIWSIPAKHHQVIDECLILSVEVFAWSTDFYIVELPHNAPQPIIEKTQKQFGIFFDSESLNFFDWDPICLDFNLKQFRLAWTNRVNIVAADNRTINKHLDLFHPLLKEWSSKHCVIIGYLGREHYRIDVDLFKVLYLNMEVVGCNV